MCPFCVCVGPFVFIIHMNIVVHTLSLRYEYPHIETYSIISVCARDLTLPTTKMLLSRKYAIVYNQTNKSHTLQCIDSCSHHCLSLNNLCSFLRCAKLTERCVVSAFVRRPTLFENMPIVVVVAMAIAPWSPASHQNRVLCECERLPF